MNANQVLMHLWHRSFAEVAEVTEEFNMENVQSLGHGRYLLILQASAIFFFKIRVGNC